MQGNYCILTTVNRTCSDTHMHTGMSVVVFHGKLRSSTFKRSYSWPKVWCGRWERDKHEGLGCLLGSHVPQDQSGSSQEAKRENYDPNGELSSDAKYLVCIFPRSMSAGNPPPLQAQVVVFEDLFILISASSPTSYDRLHVGSLKSWDL